MIDPRAIDKLPTAFCCGIWFMILADLLACHAGRALARRCLRTACGHSASFDDLEPDPGPGERPTGEDTRPDAS